MHAPEIWSSLPQIAEVTLCLNTPWLRQLSEPSTFVHLLFLIDLWSGYPKVFRKFLTCRFGGWSTSGSVRNHHNDLFDLRFEPLGYRYVNNLSNVWVLLEPIIFKEWFTVVGGLIWFRNHSSCIINSQLTIKKFRRHGSVLCLLGISNSPRLPH